MIYIYLHGFASSPKSSKAKYFQQRFDSLGIPLIILDLNQGDFSNLTLTRQLQQVETILTETQESVTLIGSSFGGLTATWLAQSHPQIEKLILLAPAFNFLSQLQSLLGETEISKWQQQGYYQFYHHGEKLALPLSYEFMLDLQNYQEVELNREIPTLIIHGIKDTVIPVESSRVYRDTHQQVKLVELDSDHSLMDVLEEIWSLIVHIQYKG
ncbi:MAG: alpha/beta fold hydrolase [Gloeocapsa sp. DLM2.Bin57]|nr:MAG: alpha/beta fold hydrolase [Gloeocapsa sp. DLM2.Bin57]